MSSRLRFPCLILQSIRHRFCKLALFKAAIQFFIQHCLLLQIDCFNILCRNHWERQRTNKDNKVRVLYGPKSRAFQLAPVWACVLRDRGVGGGGGRTGGRGGEAGRHVPPNIFKTIKSY